MLPPRIARLAAFGALAACAGMAALYLLIVFVTRPSRFAGLDGAERFLTWFAIAGVIIALLGVHVVFARQLMAMSRGERRPV